MAAVSGILGALYIQGIAGTAFVKQAATLQADNVTVLLNNKTQWQINTSGVIVYDNDVVVSSSLYKVIIGGVQFNNEYTPVDDLTISATPFTTEQYGGVFEWSVEAKNNIQDCSTFGSGWESKAKGLKSWTCGFKKYWVLDESIFNYTISNPFIIKLFNNTVNDECFIGRAYFDGIKCNTKIDGMIEEEANMTGVGNLQYLDESCEPV